MICFGVPTAQPQGKQGAGKWPINSSSAEHMCAKVKQAGIIMKVPVSDSSLGFEQLECLSCANIMRFDVTVVQ